MSVRALIGSGPGSRPVDSACQPEPFEALLRTHQDRLYRYACRLTGNQDDAEDLLQQSVLEAYQAFPRFQPGTHFDRWVCRIMHHSYLDTVRRRPRVGIESLDGRWDEDDEKRPPREVIDPHGGPDTQLLANELSEMLQRALDGLPEEFRAVVVLVDLEEMSYEEVARRRGCPVGTVRSRLHRARAMLRRALIAASHREESAAHRVIE